MAQNDAVWLGCPMADCASRKGFDPTPFKGAELRVNGVAISLDLVTAYNIPDGWVDWAMPTETGEIQTTHDGFVLYERLEGVVEFRAKPAAF